MMNSNSLTPERSGPPSSPEPDQAVHASPTISDADIEALQSLLQGLSRQDLARLDAAAKNLIRTARSHGGVPDPGQHSTLLQSLGLTQAAADPDPIELRHKLRQVCHAFKSDEQRGEGLAVYEPIFALLMDITRQGSNKPSTASALPLKAILKLAFLICNTAYVIQNQGRDELIADLQPFATAFNLLPCGALLVTENLQVLYANPAFERMFVLAHRELQGSLLGDALAVDVLPHLMRHAARLGMARCQATVQSRQAEAAMPVRLTVHCLGQIEPSGVTHYSIVFEDLFAMTHWHQELLHAQEVAKVGSWHFEFSGGPVSLTPQAEAVLGWAHGGPITYSGYLSCVHPEDRPAVEAAWDAALSTGHFQIEHRVGTGASTRWIEVQGRLEYDHEGHPTRAFGTCMEISQRKLAEQDMARLARHDALTGLPNRSHGLALLDTELANARHEGVPLALFLMGLDRFKETNERLGYAVGDQLIIALAHRLQEIWRHIPVIVRMGGDQFLLAGRVGDAKQAQMLATELRRALFNPLEVGVIRHSVDASVGIALGPQHGNSTIELLKCAEMAMYEAKRSGGGSAKVYDPESGERQHHRLRMGIRLEEAIRNDRLELVYQPKVDLHNARLSGAEALLRWHDQELGWVSPAEFIPLAEERGLILMVGDLVLEKACRQLKAWKQQGKTLNSRLAINVSPAQMADPRFAQRAITITEDAGGLPGEIEFEITESAMMHEPELALFNAHVLREAGFILSIDDFGTGYSSLTRLHTFPVRKLKIDISFIQDMLINPGHRTIVTAVIGMASALGLETVAEGVETPAQAAHLRHLACNTAQGYLFSKPLSPSEFALAWLQEIPKGEGQT